MQILLNINAQNVITESDARGEDDLSRREVEVMRISVAFEGVNGWRGIGEERVSRGIGFQMAGAE